MDFTSATLPEAMLNEWAVGTPCSSFRLPPANPFVPTEFALIDAPPALTTAAGTARAAFLQP